MADLLGVEQLIGVGKALDRHGFAVIEDFLSPVEIEDLKAEALRLIKEEAVNDKKKNVFAYAINAKNDYFINSGDKVRFFFEAKAFNEQGKLLVSEEQSVAKIGHALHNLNPIFRNLTYCNRMRDIFNAINFVEPTIMQSMVIFKNPKVGGEYTPHQDASFLCTKPIHLVGVWLALDDATEENGCLEFIPRSHKWPLARRCVRVEKENGDIELEWTSPPRQYAEDQFHSVPVKRGALVLIHGLVVHRSKPNLSDKARWIYTFHAYDKSKSVYLKDNWLQLEETNDTHEIEVSSNPEIGELTVLSNQSATEYTELSTIDTGEQERRVQDDIEEYLTHLEEVYSVIESCLKNGGQVPEILDLIQDKSDQLEKLYEQIDALDSHVFGAFCLLKKLDVLIKKLEIHNKPLVRGKLRDIVKRISASTLHRIFDNQPTKEPVAALDPVKVKLEIKQLVDQVSNHKNTIEKLSSKFRESLKEVNTQ